MYVYVPIYINAANAAKPKTFVEIAGKRFSQLDKGSPNAKTQKFHELMLYQQGCGDELFFLIGSFWPAPLEHQIADTSGPPPQDLPNVPNPSP